MVACYRGFGSVVALLSRCPFLDVNRQDKEGDTALMLAAQAGGSLLTHPPPGPLQTGPQRHTPQGILPPQTLQCWGGAGVGASPPLSWGPRSALGALQATRLW